MGANLTQGLHTPKTRGVLLIKWMDPNRTESGSQPKAADISGVAAQPQGCERVFAGGKGEVFYFSNDFLPQFISLAKYRAMKKFILLILAFIVVGFFGWKLLSDKPVKQNLKKDEPLHIGKNPSQFNDAFGELLTQYYALKDALVDWDTVKADQAAYALAAKADSLPVRTLKADSTIITTALSYTAQASSEAKALTGEVGIEARRRSFNMLTDQLYTLANAVRYDGQIIYHIKCPMAFKETE